MMSKLSIKSVGVILMVLLVLLLGFGFWNSLRKIDKFCSLIDVNTKVVDLISVANSVGVNLRGPREVDGLGDLRVYAIAESAYTMGEYACIVRANSMSGNVVAKSLGY